MLYRDCAYPVLESGTFGNKDNDGGLSLSPLFVLGLALALDRLFFLTSSRAGAEGRVLPGQTLVSSLSLLVGHALGCSSSTTLMGSLGCGVQACPREGVAVVTLDMGGSRIWSWSLSGLRIGRWAFGNLSSHMMFPLPVLPPVLGRLIASLSRRSRSSSRRLRYRARQKIAAPDKRAVPMTDTTTAMAICTSENREVFSRLRRSA